jgi:flagellar export protein FliJ
MAFQFGLAPLLRLRRSLERQHALELQKASLNLANAERTFIAFKRFLDESAQADSRSLATGCTASELHFATLLREQLEHIRGRLQSRIANLEAIRQQMAINYQRALHERDALESLRNQQRRVYQKEQARREQKEIDTAYLLKTYRRQG